MVRRRPRFGISLMEICVSLSLLALFISVFVALSSRLASAQAQQGTRAVALGHLQSCLQEIKQQGPRNWDLPLHQEFQENGASYSVDIVEQPSSFTPDDSFGRVQGSVSWKSVSGPQRILREVWVHEHLQ